MPDFWLVTTFDNVDLKDKASTASARVYSKWHFLDPDFLLKVKDGRRQLKNAVDTMPDEKRRALAEPGGVLAEGAMVKGYVLDEGAATTVSTPRAKPTGAPTIFPKKVSSELSGGSPTLTLQGGHEHPSMIFPVSLDSIFANHSTAPELLYNKCWVKYNRDSGCVSVQLCFTVSVQAFSENFSEQFPYDRHIIPFQLETRAWRTTTGEREKWNLLKEVPAWAEPKYPEDKTIVNEGLTTVDLEFKGGADGLWPFVDLSDKKPLLCLRKERVPRILFRRQGLPVFIIVLLALLIFFIRGRTIEMEYAAVSASFLTFTAYTLTVNDVLGHTTSKLTYADHYFSLAYIYYVAITMKIMAVSMTCDDLARFDHDEYSRDAPHAASWHAWALALMTLVDIIITFAFLKMHHHVHFVINAIFLLIGFAGAAVGLAYVFLPPVDDAFGDLGWCQNIDYFGTAVLTIFWLGLHVAMQLLDEPFWTNKSYVRVPWEENLKEIKRKLKQLDSEKTQGRLYDPAAGFGPKPSKPPPPPPGGPTTPAASKRSMH